MTAPTARLRSRGAEFSIRREYAVSWLPEYAFEARGLIPRWSTPLFSSESRRMIIEVNRGNEGWECMRLELSYYYR